MIVSTLLCDMVLIFHRRYGALRNLTSAPVDRYHARLKRALCTNNGKNIEETLLKRVKYH